jgi:hypothetical protein
MTCGQYSYAKLLEWATICGMLQRLSTVQKCALAYAALFLAVYSLDYVPGIMAPNGKMFGLFSMTTFVDVGHLGLGALALICGLIGTRAARGYFWFLGVFYGADVITYAIRHAHLISPLTNVLINAPHAIISVSAFFIAHKVGRGPANALQANA